MAIEREAKITYEMHFGSFLPYSRSKKICFTVSQVIVPKYRATT